MDETDQNAGIIALLALGQIARLDSANVSLAMAKHIAIEAMTRIAALKDAPP